MHATPPRINITIPTYNRADCVAKAIDGALRQSHPGTTVTVVDDGSSDDTWGLLQARYADEPRLCALRLGANVGTAQAKNVAIALGRYDAITFHDSDDIPSEHKILLQARALGLPIRADHILDWSALGHEPDAEVGVDVVVGAYDLVKMDGSVHRITRRISLVDDFFPNLQFPSKTEGDWCLINAGLFRKSVFERFGGYMDCIEEDRELRNRTIAGGCVYYFVEEPLLTKIEMSDSLTVAEGTSFEGEQRLEDRCAVWERTQRYRAGLLGPRVVDEMGVELDLDDLDIADVIHPELLALNDTIPMTHATRAHLGAWFESVGGGDARATHGARLVRATGRAGGAS